MDPIDRIASVFIDECRNSRAALLKIQRILDESETTFLAIVLLKKLGYMQYVQEDDLGLVSLRIGCYDRCIEAMDDIKTLARKISVVYFYGSDSFFVFNHEASFSYACKMLSGIGPTLVHFSNNPTQSEVINMELKLACEVSFLKLNSYSDLLCLEPMPDTSSTRGETVRGCILDDLRRSEKRVRLITLPTDEKNRTNGVDLTCHESM